MKAVTRRSVLLATAALAAMGSRGSAAAYPERTVRIVVPFAPGGPTDIMARLVAARLGERFNGTFVVDNRPGAGGNIGMSLVSHAEPDGYTLMIMSSALVVNPALYKNVPYNPATDFTPIAELGTSPNVFLATPASGITSMADIVRRAKADSKALVYASPGIGTTPHLSGELLKLAAGFEMVHVSYNGAGPAIQALLSNSVPVACVSLPPAHALIAGGQLKPLAVTSRNRWFDLKDVPTMTELGYADFVTDTFQSFLAPAKLPQAIVDALESAVLAILREPVVAEQLQTNGFEVIAHGADGMAQRIRDEVPKWRAIITKAGINPT